MTRFSERMGHTSVNLMQKESIDIGLRNLLWNILRDNALRHIRCGNIITYYTYDNRFKIFIRRFINDFKLVKDDIISNNLDLLGRLRYSDKEISYIKDWFLNKIPWHQVYDFLEFCAQRSPEEGLDDPEGFKHACNEILAQENSAYRFVGDRIASIIDDVEIAEVEQVQQDPRHPHGAREHMRAAVALYAQRPEPDYRNAIKEAISAVESAARHMTGQRNLGAAMSNLKQKHKLHKQMIEGFNKLYAYTNDGETGIRHAIMEQTVVTEADARYMIVACSAFVNYLAELSAASETPTT